MLAASAALAGLLLGFAFLFPVARLQYHAWQYRKNGNSESLEVVSQWLAEKHARRARVKKMLGTPFVEGQDSMVYPGRGASAGVAIFSFADDLAVSSIYLPGGPLKKMLQPLSDPERIR